MKLTVATCQFPVDADMRRNLQYVSRHIRTAKDRGAHVAHFPEACLSGYAGVDFPSYKGFDWALLYECTQGVLDLARQCRLWVILGSTHRLTGRHKPHNSLYIINDDGELVDRYDKRFCAGDRAEKTVDLAHYSPGNHFSVFAIQGVRCADLPRLSVSRTVPCIQTPGRPTDVPLLPCWPYHAHAFSSDARHRGRERATTQPGLNHSGYHEARNDACGSR